ncbi:MAG: DNA-deoxyinosine glycosylase [Mariprofundaceae bacterium]
MGVSRSFNYVADAQARVLILGSMPGMESLSQQQYYAHPRNRFWNFMHAIFGIDRALPYPERLLKLKRCHVALWDAAHQCERSGSLDSNIKSESIIANDFSSFFASHPAIKVVFFNGQKAAQIYRKLVLPGLPTEPKSLPLYTLPSTSPAHAAMNRDEKLKIWLKIKGFNDTVVS